MCKREVGLGFDTASVGVIDVQKSNPSQGGQVAPSRQSANNSVLEKNFFFPAICAKVLQYPY